jgi:hypothetical protein
MVIGSLPISITSGPQDKPNGATAGNATVKKKAHYGELADR